MRCIFLLIATFLFVSTAAQATDHPPGKNADNINKMLKFKSRDPYDCHPSDKAISQVCHDEMRKAFAEGNARGMNAIKVACYKRNESAFSTKKCFDFHVNSVGKW